MAKFFKEWKWTILAGLGILILGLVLRLISLTVLPVFADEAIYIRWSQIMANEPTLRFLPLSDGKQPLFMWILMFLVSRVSDPLFAGRLISVASGIGTAAGIFSLSYLLFKNKLVSATATILYALSPITFFFDRMALVDSMLTFWGVWAMFFGILTAKTLRLDFAMLTGFALGFALLTKSPAIFIAMILPITWVVSERKFKEVYRFVFLMGTAYLIAFFLYNIQRLGPNFHLLTARTADYVFPISHLWTNPKDPFIFHIKQIFTDWFIKMGTWPLLVMWLGGYVAGWKKYKKELILLDFWFWFPILVQSEYAKVFTVRYILFTLPPVFIIGGLTLTAKVKWLRVAAYGLLGAFLITSLYFNYQLLTNPEKANLPSSERSGYLEEWTAGTGIKETADLISAEQSKNPGVKIVVGTEGYFGTLPDGLQMYSAETSITVIGVGLDFTELPQSLKESFEAGNKTYFVVNDSRLKIKEENYGQFGIKLISSYKKGDRREKESREYILKGPFETLYLFEIITPVNGTD